MKEPVIVQANIKSKIKLEDKFTFEANITVGLAEGGDFYLVIDFLELTIDSFKIATDLSKLPNRLSIKSDLFEKEHYNITHIVVTKYTASTKPSITWECLSDDPSLYNS